MSTIQEDLVELRRLKELATKLNAEAKAATAESKGFQSYVLTRAEAENIDGLRSDGSLFSIVDKTNGYVDDRDAFVRWALENDEGVQSIWEMLTIDWSVDTVQGHWEGFIQALSYMELLKLEPRQERINAMVREALDDGKPMPPGVKPLPAPYVSIRKA